MVNIAGNGWLSILISLMSNHWCEIYCKMDSSISDEETSICDSDSDYSSMISHEDNRRMERKKHTNKHFHILKGENVYMDNFESEQEGLAIHHDDLKYYNNTHNSTEFQQIESEQSEEFTRNVQKFETRIKNKYRREPNTIQSSLDIETDISSINNKTKESSEKFYDMHIHTTYGITKEEIKSSRKSLKIEIISTTNKNKLYGRLKGIKDENKRKIPNYYPQHFDILPVKFNQYDAESHRTEKVNITKRIEQMKQLSSSSHMQDSRKPIWVNAVLNKHRLSATKSSLKKNQQYSEKIYGMTQKNIIKINFDEHDDTSRKPLRTKLKLKKNLLRSTRIREPSAYELHEEDTSPGTLYTIPTMFNTSASITMYDISSNPTTDAISSIYDTHKGSTPVDTSKQSSKIVELSENLSPYAIEKQMKRIVQKYRGHMNITIEIIGRTVEYNNIVLLKITEAEKSETYFRVKDTKFADEVDQKKIIFIVHGLSVMGMRHLISNEEVFHKLLSCYTENYLKKFDIFLIPMANPDGYAATCNSHAGQFWNKNMSPQSACPGVALDRNFNVAWDNKHNISSCSPMYPGPAPFSEAETRAVQNVLHLYAHKIAAYIHVHASSYDQKVFKGDAVLYPRGFTDIQTDDDKYIDLKGEIDEAMKNTSFRVVSVTTDTLYNWYGKVNGTSVDYASSVYGIPYAMEFAMQIYKGIQLHALDSIWKRIIDVVFGSIWKHLQKNTDY